MAEGRIRTFVGGLDPRMEGGIPDKYITLICGRAGTMKSTLSYYILFNNAKIKKKRGIYVTLEQSRVSLLEHMIKLGMDPRELSDSGIVVIDMTRLRKETKAKTVSDDVNWVDSILSTVETYKTKYACEILVLDSLAALYSLATFNNPRSDVFFFFEKLRELDMSIFIISEMLDPDKELFGMFGVEDFLADGIIHLDLEKSSRRVNLFLSVFKMRKTNHDRSYYPLLFEGSKFEIVTE
ncbi:MAG: circadian clock protein KaiC [Candidatus Thermoplasmatota archaeon]|nr:circadian clock protein KaiC [Euryarchaeota archaeon]MBU4032695.1 circadian clock protein KaiC [Candidatus Thermoplasmatota archaeon]MBU4071672.1 circadian clock protein KaiC [Candidatus Thermoplasmatota archaeon]MBU4145304.1 circadian clock protein KaiC [Candidatus Thermoplasmatota archaeon]MBU4591069.1 circadian clock protein KaiC [Candidatus Thermoplasmatota archaeon]